MMCDDYYNSLKYRGSEMVGLGVQLGKGLKWYPISFQTLGVSSFQTLNTIVKYGDIDF